MSVWYKFKFTLIYWLNKDSMIYIITSFFLFLSFGLFFSLGVLSIFCCFLLLSLLVVKDLSIWFDCLFELSLESLEIFLACEFGTELLRFRFLIWDVISCPAPCIIAGLHLLQLTEDILSLKQVIHNTLMSFLGPNKHSHKPRLLMLKKLKFPNAPLFPLAPPPIDFTSKFNNSIFFLLTSNNRDFRQIAEFPIAYHLGFGVVILVHLVFVFTDLFGILGHSVLKCKGYNYTLVNSQTLIICAFSSNKLKLFLSAL